MVTLFTHHSIRGARRTGDGDAVRGGDAQSADVKTEGRINPKDIDTVESPSLTHSVHS